MLLQYLKNKKTIMFMYKLQRKNIQYQRLGFKRIYLINMCKNITITNVMKLTGFLNEVNKL